MRCAMLVMILFGFFGIAALSDVVLGDDLKFPKVDVPDVMPPKLDATINKLPIGEFYVITNDAPMLVIDSPSGNTIIEGKKGPVTLGGKFVDGTAPFEWREYEEGLFVYVVRGVKATKAVELIVVRDLSQTTVVRKTIEITGKDVVPDPDIDPVPDQSTEFEKAIKIAYQKAPNEDLFFLPGMISMYQKLQETKQTTWVGLFNEMSKLNDENKLVGHFTDMKKVIQEELKSVFPSGELDSSLKIDDIGKVTKTFKKIEVALTKVK